MNSRNLLVGFLCVIGLSACAVAPTQEMADARAELKAAEEAGAREYANQPLTSARRSMVEAEQQLALGNYGEARSSAAQARADAARAKAVTTAIARAQGAVERAKQVKGLWTDAEKLLKSAQDAARSGDDQRALDEAGRAEKLAMLGENQALLEQARLLLESCPEAKRASHAELLRKATEAIANGKGAAALDSAAKACR